MRLAGASPAHEFQTTTMTTTLSHRLHALTRVASLALLFAAPLTGHADARVGGGFSFGSRGSRTFSAPAATPTAPRYSQPFQQSDTPRVRPGMPGQPGRFGFGTGLLAGLFGAGLFGMASGAGFFGGIAALFGLLFKLALVGGVIWLVLRMLRGRSPQMAGGPTVLPGAASMGARQGGSQGGGAVTLQPADYQVFERSLSAIQEAYSREDTGALSRLMTAEMVRRLAADIDANQRRGLRNDVSGTRLLQGDLSEAWREGSTSYATLAMRFAAIDVMLDRASGRIMSGDPVKPVEATELWTFRREGLGPWILSGIQQAA